MGENESDQVQKTTGITSLLQNPVFLTAVFGAIIAACANAYVAFKNNNTLLDIETHREAQEQLIEARKAEFTLLLEISKLDVEPAKKKIKAFCEMMLISDQAICLSNALSPKDTLSGSPSSSTTIDFTQAMWDSPWVSGGHSQQEMCNNGVLELRKNDLYKGKVILLQFASEDSKKDFLGHVEYKYHCIYRVSKP